MGDGGSSTEELEDLKAHIESLKVEVESERATAVGRLAELKGLREERSELHQRAHTFDEGDAFEQRVRQRSTAFREAEAQVRKESHMRTLADQRALTLDKARSDAQGATEAWGKKFAELEGQMRGAFDQQCRGNNEREGKLRSEGDAYRQEINSLRVELQDLGNVRKRDDASAALVHRLQEELQRCRGETQRYKDIAEENPSKLSQEDEVTGLANEIDTISEAYEEVQKAQVKLTQDMRAKDDELRSSLNERAKLSNLVENLERSKKSVVDEGRSALELAQTKAAIVQSQHRQISKLGEEQAKFQEALQLALNGMTKAKTECQQMHQVAQQHEMVTEQQHNDIGNLHKEMAALKTSYDTRDDEARRAMEQAASSKVREPAWEARSSRCGSTGCIVFHLFVDRCDTISPPFCAPSPLTLTLVLYRVHVFPHSSCSHSESLQSGT